MNTRTKLITSFLAGSILVTASSADYIRDREAAMARVNDREYEEGLAAFRTAAEQPGLSDFQKSDALREAALCAIRLGRYDEANAIAETIPIRSVGRYCWMRILTAQRQFEQLVADFRDADLAAWPDDVAREAFRLRGDAYYHRQLGEEAVRDYRRALAFPQEHGRTVNKIRSMMAAAYRRLLEDDATAITVYRQICGTGPVRSIDGCFATIAIARILSGQGKHEAALAELDRIDREASQHPHLMQPHTLWACGDVLSAAGRGDEARRRYEQALRVEGIQPHVKAACEQGIEALQE